MVVFNYYNQDGYIKQIAQWIVSAMEECGIQTKVAYDNEVVEVCKKYKPEILICFHPPYNFHEYLQTIRQINCHKILWDLESPFELDVIERVKGEFGYIFEMDLNSANKLRENYGGQVLYVPCAVNTEVYKPLKEVEWQYKSDLCFVGNPFKSRIKFFQEVMDFLKDYYVTLIGWDWKSVLDTGNQHLVRDIIPGTEVNKYYNGAKVVLNLQRTSEDSWGWNSSNIFPISPGDRTFEIAASGTVQMVDNSRAETANFYKESEIVTFTDPEDFKFKFTRLINEADYRKKVAENALKTTLNENTWKHRIEKYLKNLL